MGFRLSGQILETVTGLTPAQKLILIGLAERADKGGMHAFPSVATLATYAECSPRNVELGLKQLLADGWVKVQKKATNRLPTTYCLNIEKLTARGEKTSPQTSNSIESPNENRSNSARGEDSSPQTPSGGGEESSPQSHSRGEVFGTAGANFSASRGEETSPYSVSKEPIQEPIRNTPDAGASVFALKSAYELNLARLLKQFERLWTVYPNGSAKKQAWQQFQHLNPSAALCDEMFEAIEFQKRHQWGGVDPQKIPHFRNWLRHERWTDARDDVAPVSQDELIQAMRILGSRYAGQCPHGFQCPGGMDCLKSIALQERTPKQRRLA